MVMLPGTPNEFLSLNDWAMMRMVNLINHAKLIVP